MAKTRKKPELARAAILDMAQLYLMEGGPDAVKVQKIADAMGMSDAAIHYHFNNRQSLLEALLKHAGKRLKSLFVEIDDGVDEADIIGQLDDIYRTQGYAKLAMYLSLAGWRSEGEGMFVDLVRQHPSYKKNLQKSQFKIAMLNLMTAAEPLMGEAFLRSVGLAGDEEERAKFRKFMADKLAD